MPIRGMSMQSNRHIVHVAPSTRSGRDMLMMIPDLVRAMEQIEPAQYDDVLAKISLPLCGVFHPLGFPLEIHTNSPAVLAAAQQSWGLFQPRFSCAPLTLRIGVTENTADSPDLPAAPVCRIENNLLANVADARNFVVSDLNAGFSFGWVTQQTAESSVYLRYYILEATVLSMVAGLRAAPLHAACVAPFGHGMLLCGDSGAGKSSLAFAGARTGWTFVSDDASYLPFDRKNRIVVGNCHKIRLRDSGVQLFPELEGRPVTPRAAGKPSIEIPTADMPELLLANSATVEFIIFLNRRDVKAPGLVPFSRKAASPWFNQSLFSTTASYDAQKAALHHLLDVEILELRYTDLDWAIDRLETLALTGK